MFDRLASLNLQQWIRDRGDTPPTKTFLWKDSGFWAFIIPGPSRRTVFHVNPGDEIFHQVVGEMQLHFVRDGQRDLVILRPGDFFLLPANVPHCPRRDEGSWTLVITTKRTVDAEDQWFWYCEKCGATLHQVGMVGRREDDNDVVAEATSILQADDRRRTCSRCGHLTVV
jgi:3-hydroxyanthranilate 3,4-dioxygenase